MKIITLIVLLLTAALKAFAGEIKITANLTGFSDNTMVYLINGQTPLAYQTLSQGTVQLTADVPETPESYALYIVENNQPYYTMLFVANETIDITAAKEDFPYSVKVSGSQYHPVKVLLDEMQAPVREKSLALEQEIRALEASGEWEKPEVKAKYIGDNGLSRQITKELKQVETDFILDHLHTAYGFSLLEYNKTGADKDFYEAVCKKMTPEQKQSKIGRQYLVASKSKRLEKGDVFIDFAVSDQALAPRKLSDYFAENKEYVLIDFSSVSCPSSNQSFPVTKSFADQYTDKLEVVSVLQSPDASTYQQFGALSTENWAVVYAEDFTNTDAYIQYQENATPTFLLFDKSGKLIDRWTGALIHQQKMEQYLTE